MKKFATVLAITTLLSVGSAVAADKYTLDPTHTNLYWKANHFGFSNPSGKFTEVEGSFVLDQSKPENSSVAVVVRPASVLTGIPKFDEHLKSPDFFNVLKYQEATFKSFKVEVTGKDTAKIQGDLTLLGITKRYTLDAKLNKVGTNPFGKEVAGFTITGVVKRSDFGMRYGLPGVSDEVLLTIDVEGIKDAPEKK